MRCDPEAAAQNAEAAAEVRGVWVSDQMSEGTRSIRIEADALDATAFEHTIDAIADTLAGLGDTDRKDVRRAKAVGVIADPQTTLDLSAGEQETDTGRPDPAGGPAGGAGSAAGFGTTPRRPGSRKPKVTLYLHLHQDAITTRQGVGRVEGLGPVTVEKIADWVGRSDLTIKPVLDLADRAAVDAYEVPDQMAETVYLRNPCCPFPWCTNRSRLKDTDHIKAYVPPDDGGPPGQTTAHNLAPPCRRHHRLKTHGGWTYTMPEPGIYLWRSPADRRYLVDHTGTTTLPHPA